jgi:hypothetical protein
MKMVKSYTRRKFVKKKAPNKPPDQVTQLINQTTDYIKQWTQRELGRIQEDQNTSICIPTNTGYKIGLYNLRVNPNKTCELFDRNSELVHVFESKISAILYTIYTIKRRYRDADNILRIDTEINKHYTDMLTLRRGIARATLEKDYIALDSRHNRLEIAERELAIARAKMMQIHRTAKLNKVWV